MANSLLSCSSGQSRRWVLNKFLAVALAVLTLPLHAQMTTFNATGANQFYTVPANGTLTITARGGDGGNGSSFQGGSAATALATFTVQQGDVLTIVAGQKGVSSSAAAGGGGGGTAVIASRSGAKTLLLVAGAGGGGGRFDSGVGGGGIGFGGGPGGGGGGGGSGGGGFGAGGDGGIGGGGGAGDENGGGSGGIGFGGGFGGGGGFGFGGGGGGSFDGGGGGGYQGGNSGNFSGGGGGSSFVQAAGVFAGTSPSVTLGTNGGSTTTDGSVVLNLVAAVNNSCGPNGQNVKMCYYGQEICVPKSYVARYQSIGATVGGCASGRARLSYEPQSSGIPLQLALKAFPNPVQDAMTLEVLAPKAGLATFEVLDMTGRARQTRRENLVEGLNEIELRLGALPTGLYLIRAVDALGQQGVVKISKE